MKTLFTPNFSFLTILNLFKFNFVVLGLYSQHYKYKTLFFTPIHHILYKNNSTFYL